MNSIFVLVRNATAHYSATCVGCGARSEFCPRDSLGIDEETRAARAFHRAGWRCELPYDHGLRQSSYESALRRGAGEWTCPACVRLAHPARPGARTREGR